MKTGDILSIGRHRLMCGDSTNIDDINKLLEDKKFDICITDPPYLWTPLDLDKDGIDIEKLVLMIKENMKLNSWVFVYGTLNIASTFEKHLRHKFEYVWNKPIATPIHPTTMRPMLSHEICWAFIHPELVKVTKLHLDRKALRTEGKAYTVKRKIRESEYNNAYRHEASTTENTGYREGKTSLYFISKGVLGKRVGYYHNEFGIKTDHPTQKPQAMYELILNGYCQPKGMIFEPCGGSGTGMVAAEVTGRTCYMMEKSPKYCDIIINRMKTIQTKMDAYS